MFYLQNFYTTTLCLAYQSLGIVYGDLSISPIYVYKSTFSGGLQLYEEDHEILGVLSMVFWTLTLIPLCKYIIFVLAADDNGEGVYSNLNYHIPFHYLKKYMVGCCWNWRFTSGFTGGTFALYSSLCRHSRMGILNTVDPVHQGISSCRSEISNDTRTSLLIKEFFEKHKSSRIVLLLVVFLGTGMVIGDGILTPTMSGMISIMISLALLTDPFFNSTWECIPVHGSFCSH